jgi:hypothetical protein
MRSKLHQEIETIIIETIRSVSQTSTQRDSTTPFELGVGVIALPEELDVNELAKRPETLRLAINTNTSPEDGYTASGYGVIIRAFKPYITFNFRERGVATAVTLPWATVAGTTDRDFLYLHPLRDLRFTGCRCSFPSVAAMEECMSTLRRGFTLRDPDKTTHCYAESSVRPWDCPHTGGVGSFGRPVATINTMLKGYGLPQIDTQTGNEMLAEIAVAALDEMVVVSWLEGSISELYAFESSDRQTFSSCMKGQDSDYFEIYDDLQRAGILRMLLVHRASGVSCPSTGRSEHIGRALVWFGQNPSDIYLDRIYCPSATSSSDPRPDIIKAIGDFCGAENITKAVFDQTSRLIPSLTLTALRVPCNFYYNAYPYVDSLRYLYNDGWLSTSSSRGYTCRVLDNTDGRYAGSEDEDDEEDTIECACGGWYPESEVCYSSARDEHYYEGDVSWVSTSSTYIPNADIVNINGQSYDSERDDVVELHDGNYALLEDVVELHDGNYALIEDAHQNKQGEWNLNP